MRGTPCRVPSPPALGLGGGAAIGLGSRMYLRSGSSRARVGLGVGRAAGARRTTPACAGQGDRQQAPGSAQRHIEALRLPLDYYRLLHVPAVASRDTITTAFDRRLNSPPGLGYSQATLLARGTMLKGIMQTLTDPAMRRAYDDRLQRGDIAEDVPDNFVPGALDCFDFAVKVVDATEGGGGALTAASSHKRGVFGELPAKQGGLGSLAALDLVQAWPHATASSAVGVHRCAAIRLAIEGLTCPAAVGG